MNQAVKVDVVPLLWVRNMANSLEFYRQLGFEVVETWEPESAIQWCSLRFGDAQLMLQQTEDSTATNVQEADGSGIELYFVCSDLKALYQRYSRAGLKSTKPRTAFYPMEQIFLRDPDGRSLCFETPVPVQQA